MPHSDEQNRYEEQKNKSEAPFWITAIISTIIILGFSLCLLFLVIRGLEWIWGG